MRSARFFLLVVLVAAPLSAAAQQPLATQQRQFAPGVVTVIPTEIMPEETTAVHDIVELQVGAKPWRPELIAESQTLFERSQSVRFRRDIWQLEFAFKPLRMIWVELPTALGGTERRLVWYLVYRVTNRGDALATSEQQDGFYATASAAGKPINFLPHFVLEGHEDDENGSRLYRAYLDQLIPAAIEPIRRRELPGRRLLSSVEMTEQDIPVSTADNEQSVWGVAMWTDVDPDMDFFSVFVRGLTNAYRWSDPPGAYQAGRPPGSGRQFVRKTLQLCFWRPGDRFLEHESEIRFGPAPGRELLYGVDEGVAHRWIYR